MPTWLFFTLLAAAALALAVFQLWSFALTARIMKSDRATFWRGCVPPLVMTVIGAMSLALPVADAPGLVAVQYALAGVGVIAGIVMYRAVFALSWWRSLAGWALALLGSAAVVFVLVLVVIRPLWVQGFSYNLTDMSPGIHAGERFLVDKLAAPARWDIIVFESPTTPPVPWLRRVAGLPGETVSIDERGFLINGARVELPAALIGLRFDAGIRTSALGELRAVTQPLQLEAGEYFVIADAPMRGLDSRNLDAAQTYPGGVTAGAIPASAVIGVVRWVYVPWASQRVVR